MFFSSGKPPKPVKVEEEQQTSEQPENLALSQEMLEDMFGSQEEWLEVVATNFFDENNPKMKSKPKSHLKAKNVYQNCVINIYHE